MGAMTQDLTYAEAGETRDAVMPAGYGYLELNDAIGQGRDGFEPRRAG